MDKYEYKVEVLPAVPNLTNAQTEEFRHKLEAFANKLGMDGWEFFYKHDNFCWFKRKLK